VACLDPAAPTPAPKPYDCKDRLESWEAEWEEGKKAWCCLYESVGCSPVEAKYDCEEGISSWRVAWAAEKKAWCCQNYRLGCVAAHGDSTGSAAAAAAASGDSSAAAAHDSPAGGDDRRGANASAGTSQAPSASKARPSAVAASTRANSSAEGGGAEASPAFDCAAPPRRQQAWSDEKKGWCCEHESKGCNPSLEDAFDCQEGLAHWREHWDADKQAWCCISKQKGCLGPSLVESLSLADGLRSARLYGAGRVFRRRRPGPLAGAPHAVALAGLLAACIGLGALRVVARRRSRPDFGARPRHHSAGSGGLE